MDSKNYSQQEVLFYPKLILGNIKYDTSFVKEIFYEIGIELTQEQILNTIINITIENNDSVVRQDTIKSFVPCLIDGTLVETYSVEIKELVRYYTRISDELSNFLKAFISFNGKTYFSYINWSSGDIVFSKFELNEQQSTVFKRLFDDQQLGIYQ